MLNITPGLVAVMMRQVLYRGRCLIEPTIRPAGFSRSRLRRACRPVGGALRPLRGAVCRLRRACGGVGGALRSLRGAPSRLSSHHRLICGGLSVFHSFLRGASAERQGAGHQANH